MTRKRQKSSLFTSVSLWTDLYQLVLAAAYFTNNVNVNATFELYVQSLPKNRSYLIAAGLEQVVEYLKNLRFTTTDINYLKSIPYFSDIPDEFFGFLKEVRFTGELWAVPEGTPFFEREPIIRITAPIIEAQIVESYILSIVNYQVSVASKAARLVHSAGGSKVVDFGFRRAPGPEAAHYASRAAYIAGFEATSNLEGGRRYGIPMIETLPYSFVLPFESEREALKKYAKTFPDGALVLIDTLDPKEATRRVVACGEKFKGVRISTKNILPISREVREILNSAGGENTKIVASGELNEEKIERLVKAHAPVDYYGVGSELVLSKDSYLIEGVYKLVEIEDRKGVRYPAKFHAGKEVIPCKKQILRKIDKRGRYAGDLVVKAGEVPKEDEVVYLRKIMESGKVIDYLPSIKKVRNYCAEELSKIPDEVKRIKNPKVYPVKISPELLKVLK